MLSLSLSVCVCVRACIYIVCFYFCKPSILHSRCFVSIIFFFYITQSDQNQAIAMVSYCASSSEPPQVRGKSVYIQYSNRQEIVNNKSTGDISGNVLLVTIEGVEAGDVSIDVIHLVRFTLFSSTTVELVCSDVTLTDIDVSLL